MVCRELSGRAIWLMVGIVLGAVAVGLLPHAPLHAVSNDRGDTFAICTGPMDGEVEAIFFLDFLTGDLSAAAISPMSRKFVAYYRVNVLAALGVDASKAPRYLMVSGQLDLRRGTGPRLGSSVVYIAEANSGKVACFAVPWVREMINAGKTVQATLVPLDAATFRTAAVRPGG
jgi:hypothetical protein